MVEQGFFGGGWFLRRRRSPLSLFSSIPRFAIEPASALTFPHGRFRPQLNSGPFFSAKLGRWIFLPYGVFYLTGCIPARAVNTFGHCDMIVRMSVHPRSCGEHRITSCCRRPRIGHPRRFHIDQCLSSGGGQWQIGTIYRNDQFRIGGNNA